jgi:hypothetical protein
MEAIRTDIKALYDLARTCNDDLEIVAFFLTIINHTSKATIIKDLETLKTKSYEDDINYLLDNVTTTTIRNICKIHKDKKAVTDGC